MAKNDSPIDAAVSEVASPRPARSPFWIAAASFWIVLAGAGVAWGAVVVHSGDLYCEHAQRDSEYGELSWSIVPPGPVCEWVAVDADAAETRGPSPVMSVWLGTLAVLGASVLATRR